MVESSSPLTGNLINEKNRDYSAAQIIIDWKSIYGIDVADELIGIVNISRYRCPDSGLYFFSPSAAQASDNLYQSLSKFPWYYADDKWEYTKCLESLPPNQHLLEIGCGDGHFLSLAAADGHDAFGIDINSKAIKFAEERGLNVQCCDVTEHARNRESLYDCVCSFQVLEHLIDVRTFLEDATKLLKPGGLLILATPNADSFLRYQYNLLDLPPHHMTQWSCEAYNYLEKILPLKLIHIFNEPIADIHFEGFIQSTSAYISKRYAFGSKLGKTLIKYALEFVSAIGFRRYFKGQCMMAVFENTTSSPKHHTKTEQFQKFANIGCGTTLHKDWENYDMASSDPCVRTIDIRHKWTLNALSYDFIYSSHVLEHLQRSEARSFLVNCYNSLRPGGILRIAVPDLEGICREYINQLEATRSGQPNAARKHQWMTLELLDQMVRTRSGGAMAHLWSSGYLPESDFIIDRLGSEAAKHIKQFKPEQTAPSYEAIFSRQNKQKRRHIEQFRNAGEIHQWMYDELSLGSLLKSIGFVAITRHGSADSSMKGFSKYHLDTDASGCARKPDSLYMECMRPE